jgi:F0F1-type ATP synthase beta subunit
VAAMTLRESREREVLVFTQGIYDYMQAFSD